MYMLLVKVSRRCTVLCKFHLTLQNFELELLSLKLLIKHFRCVNQVWKASLIKNLTICVVVFFF